MTKIKKSKQNTKQRNITFMDKFMDCFMFIIQIIGDTIGLLFFF